jgi:Fe-S oxidoreductase
MVRNSRHSYSCPSISRYNYHAYSGSGRLIIGREAVNKGIKYTDRLLNIVYNCQMCGACDISCKYAMDMEVLEPINEFRIRCVEDGKTNPALEKVIGNLRKTGSMVPVKGKRGDWAEGLNIKNAAKEKVDVLYHVGCLTSYDKDMQKLARATAKILQKAGVDFGIRRRRDPLRRTRLPDGIPKILWTRLKRWL